MKPDTEKPKAYNIKVNAVPTKVTEDTLNYDQVVKLAFPDANFDTTVYTVLYSKGPEPKPKGSMSPGDTVAIKDGMVFNVSGTGKS